MKKNRRLHRRLDILSKLLALSFIGLAIVLFKIQIIDHEKLSEMTDRQSNMVITSDIVRGDILDRNGISFTTGREIRYIKVYPYLIEDREDIVEIVGRLTNMDRDKLEQEITSNAQGMELAVSNVDEETIERIVKGIYPGLYTYTRSERYDSNSLARHVVGYIQRDGSPIMGIEKIFHELLDSGDKRFMYTFKDANDKPIAGAGYIYRDTTNIYHDVQLTLDYNIQMLTERALDSAGGRNGAIVVDVESGEILAAASRPNYKQYDIPGSIEPDCLWAVPFKAFSPGSVFKVVVAALGLEEGLYSEDDIFHCDGGITINGVLYSCHRDTGGLGTMTLREAFARSCNDTFIEIARDLGGDDLVAFAEKFGVGHGLNIGFSNDDGGLPARSVYAGAGIGNLALGQGDVMVTPLQMVDLMTTIVNGGMRRPLRLVKQIISSEGDVISWQEDFDPYPVISEETAHTLQEWLIDAAKYGTGRRAYDEEFGGCGGKTGTPQINHDIHTEHYGWFVGFFPEDEPKYAMGILSREEGEGGRTAAPIFKEIARGIHNYNDNIVP